MPNSESGREHFMPAVIQLLTGALACLAFVLLARRAGSKREATIYAAALVVAALIYVGFAAVGGAALLWVALEAGGLVLFSVVALLGLRFSVWALVLGWIAHVGWDVLLHKVLVVGFAPKWYPFVCVGFDLFLAGYIAVSIRERRWPGAPRR